MSAATAAAKRAMPAITRPAVNPPSSFPARKMEVGPSAPPITETAVPSSPTFNFIPIIAKTMPEIPAIIPNAFFILFLPSPSPQASPVKTSRGPIELLSNRFYYTRQTCFLPEQRIPLAGCSLQLKNPCENGVSRAVSAGAFRFPRPQSSVSRISHRGPNRLSSRFMACSCVIIEAGDFAAFEQAKILSLSP